MQKIIEYLEHSYFPERGLEKNSRLNTIIRVGTFGRFLNRAPTLGDLNYETLNKFIAHRLQERASETVRGERSVLRAIWNHAHEAGLIDRPPSRIRKIKKVISPPVAWDQSALRKLLLESSRQRGLLRGKGISRAAYWNMFFRVAYDTGLRLGDLERLRTDQIKGPGSFYAWQNKTKNYRLVSIDSATWAAIQATNPTKRTYLVRVMQRSNFYDALKIIVGNCGLTGATKMIRRGAGSLFERDHPGEGQKVIGNSRETFLTHYNDTTISDRPGRMPPRLGETG